MVSQPPSWQESGKIETHTKVSQHPAIYLVHIYHMNQPLFSRLQVKDTSKQPYVIIHEEVWDQAHAGRANAFWD